MKPYKEKNCILGIVKITPAHDQFDYEVAKNNNLKMIDIIDENGLLNDNAGQYAVSTKIIFLVD